MRAGGRRRSPVVQGPSVETGKAKARGETSMSIVAEIVKEGSLESVAKAALAGVPRVGDGLHIRDEYYVVTGVDHYAVDLEPPPARIAPLPETPSIAVAVRRG